VLWLGIKRFVEVSISLTLDFRPRRIFGRVRLVVLPLPHPIPYQGSKRALAPLIAPFIPPDIGTWYEPFAGSAAMTLWATRATGADRFIIADSLAPIAALWKEIIERPVETSKHYRAIWEGQKESDTGYFNSVRTRYNEERDPIDLLYLICRCVKNAVRFNKKGSFTQSHDKRRLGMRPEKMASAIEGASYLLKGRTEVRVGDWRDTTADARKSDFLYMDPPYLGTSIGKDKRYAHQMTQEPLIEGLGELIARQIRFALSYDGMTGEKEYGPPLPDELGMTRLLLHAGVSSQATLVGRKEETIESLYMSPGLAKAQDKVIRLPALQPSLAF
jgi:DNA adenine methylase